MLENYRLDPTFNPEYSFSNAQTNETARTPYKVAVSGVGSVPKSLDPFLGIGEVIGTVDLEGLSSEMPVIEIKDREDGLLYTILGCESWWACITPEDERDIERNIQVGALAVYSVKQYIIDTIVRHELTTIEDNFWLRENGVDPDA